MQDDQRYWDAQAVDRINVSDDGIVRVNTNMRKQRKLIQKLCQYDFSKKYVLEIGCGVGVLGAYSCSLYTPQMRYVGIDLSQKMAKMANSQFGLRTVCSRSTALPFPSSLFDFVFAFDVMEHISKQDKTRTYMEIDRVMKTTSSMFINNPNYGSLHSLEMEHGFDMYDLAILCDVCSFRVTTIDTIRVEEFNQSSQFMVLTR